MVETTKDVYDRMLNEFPDTLKQISEDTSKAAGEGYMTLCEMCTVNFDKFKDYTSRRMKLAEFPNSCDALYRNQYGEYFLIEFKNGQLERIDVYEIKVKIFESLLMLSSMFSQTIDLMRDNLIFVLVYNEDIISSIEKIHKKLFGLADVSKRKFGLHRFEKIYFRSVRIYSKAEFELEFVNKYSNYGGK